MGRKLYDHGESIMGEKFGRLTVIGSLPDIKLKSGRFVHAVLCKCECGTEKAIQYYPLIRGDIRSCGCLERESRSRTHTSHGLSHLRIYHTYKGMITRCYSKTNKAYPDYGGRGIYICNEWYTPGVSGNPGFIAFYEWSIQNGYFEQPKGTSRGEILTIDRINNDGPYAPWNCRWVTQESQAKNRRTVNSIVDMDGAVYNHAEFESKYGLKEFSIHSMLINHWTYDDIVYIAHHPELGIRKTTGIKPRFVDKDGFTRLIPTRNNSALYK